MAIKIPPGTHPDIAAAIRELARDRDRLLRELETLKTQNFSLQGRRVTGASEAVLPNDYVTKGQLERMISQIKVTPQTAIRVSATGTGGGGGGGGGGLVLPPATHRINFGYYFSEYRNVDKWTDVVSYINTHYCTVKSGNGNSTDPPSVWVPTMASRVGRAYNAGKRLHILFEYDHADVHPYIDQVLNGLAPYWDRIFSIEIADEPRNPDGTYMNEIQFNLLARDLKAKIAAHGLSTVGRSFAVSLSPDEALDSAIVDSDEIERVGANLYLDIPGSGDPATEVAALDAFIDAFIAYVPDGSTFGASAKDLHFTMMAYDRNGSYADIPSLVAIQSRYYLKAYNNPRVRALYAFSYARPGGTFDHPEMKAPHQSIYNALKHLD